MSILLFILTLVAMLAVLVVLGLGVFNLARGGSGALSNKLMRWRVLLQAVAIVLVVALAWAWRHGM